MEKSLGLLGDSAEAVRPAVDEAGKKDGAGAGGNNGAVSRKTYAS